MQGGEFDEVQLLSLSNASGGTFRLAWQGETTGALDYDATAAEVEAALEGLNALDQVTVTGSAGGPWTVTFAGTHAGQDVALIMGDATSATSGTLIRTIELAYDKSNNITSADDSDSSYAYMLPAALISCFWPNCDCMDFWFVGGVRGRIIENSGEGLHVTAI